MKLKTAPLLLWCLVVLNIPCATNAHYDPGIQHWITRDPMQEEGGINLHEVVNGDPVNLVDFWGLSQEDACRIMVAANDSIKKMTQEGKRLENGYLNNILGSVGCGYYGCVKQTGQTFKDLLKEEKKHKFDDKWNLKHIYKPPFAVLPPNNFVFPHNFLEAESSNPSDPKIIIDPWSGKVEGAMRREQLSPMSNVNANSIPAMTLDAGKYCK